MPTEQAEPLDVAQHATYNPHVGMRHFNESEFVRRARPEGLMCSWWAMMHPQLMSALDNLRHRCGHPIIISPANGSVARVGPENASSDHYCNVEAQPKHLCCAVDVMPKRVVQQSDGTLLSRSLNADEALRFFVLAYKCGFNAVGIYPDWLPRPGFHLGLRPSTPTMPAALAQWGATREPLRPNDPADPATIQTYCTAQWALRKWEIV